MVEQTVALISSNIGSPVWRWVILGLILLCVLMAIMGFKGEASEGKSVKAHETTKGGGLTKAALFVGVVIFAILQGTNMVADFGEKFPKVLAWIAQPETAPRPELQDAKSDPAHKQTPQMAGAPITPSAPFGTAPVAPTEVAIKAFPEPSNELKTASSEAAPVPAPAPKKKLEQKKIALVSPPDAPVATKPEPPVETHVGTGVAGWVGATMIPGSVGTSKDMLVIAIKSELRRLKCFSGAEDATWSKDIKSAVQRFNVYGYTRISVEPEQDTIAILQGYKDAVCP